MNRRFFNRSVFFLILGLIFFSLFAYGIEFKRSIITWYYLTGYIFCWMLSFSYFIISSFIKLTSKQ